MEFYKSCRTLSIYSFNEILKTNDLRFLVKDFDEYSDDEFKLVGVDLVDASEIFKDIIYEYSELTFNKTILSNYTSQINIEKEEFRYDITEKILNLYSLVEDAILLEPLNNIGWKFDINGDIEEQIKGIIANMKRVRTRINVLKHNYKEKFKKKIVEDGKETYVDKLDSETIALEIALKISYSINTKTTSVSKWISMWDLAEKRQKQYANHQPT